MPVHQLVYCSQSALVGSPAEQTLEVAKIVESARRNNTAHAITGGLIFSGSRFAQVLEGERRAVELTFERVVADARHRDISQLGFAEIDERSFPLWSMGFAQAIELSDVEAMFTPASAASDGVAAASMVRLIHSSCFKAQIW